MTKFSSVLKERTTVFQKRTAHGSHAKGECPTHTHTSPTVQSDGFSKNPTGFCPPPAGPTCSNGDKTRQNQPVQPNVTRPGGSNLQARSHSEVAQNLNSELTSSSVEKKQNQI